jgi:hypothetical protein
LEVVVMVCCWRWCSRLSDDCGWLVLAVPLVLRCWSWWYSAGSGLMVVFLWLQ